MVDKVLATRLREEGLSYADIAKEVECSIDWCKQNLKGVSKNSIEKKAIAEAISLAQTKDGITNGEIKFAVRSVYPFENNKEYETMEKKAIARFKDAINKSENTVIRPYWMQPENAQISFNMVLAAVDNIGMHMTDEVDHIRKTLNFNQSYDNSLRYAIIKMLMSSTLCAEGIENHCDYLSNVANKLEAKNTDDYTLSTPIYYSPSKCTLKQPTSEKCISAEEYTILEYEPIGLDDILSQEWY